MERPAETPARSSAVPRSFRSRRLAAALCALLTAPAAAWTPHWSLDLKGGDDRSVGRIDWFQPLRGDAASLSFLLLRGVADDRDSRELNLGLGHRRVLGGSADANAGVLGIYGFFDLRRSAAGNRFHQLTLGGEYLGPAFEARINAYLTPDRRKVIGSTTGAVTGIVVNGTQVEQVTTTTTTTLREFALPGVDASIGHRARLNLSGTEAELGLGAGYFHFERNGVRIAGPEARLELGLDDLFGQRGSRLTLGAEWRRDGVRGDRRFAFLRLRLPLGRTVGSAPAARALERRMTRRVERDVDIVLGSATSVTRTTSTPVPVLDPLSGQPIGVYHFSQGGTGDCSAAAPCDYATAQTLAGVGDVLVARDSGGTISTSTSLTLEDRQQLLGAGYTGSVSTVLSSGDALTLSGLGGRPVIDGGNNVISLVVPGNDGRVQGVALTGGNKGIYAANKRNITIRDVHVSDLRRADAASNTMGIYAVNVDGLLVEDADVFDFAPGAPGGAGYNSVMGIRLDNVRNATLRNNSILRLSSTGTAAGHTHTSGVLTFNTQNLVLENNRIEDLSGNLLVRAITLSDTDATLNGDRITGLTSSDPTGTFGVMLLGTTRLRMDGVTISNITNTGGGTALGMHLRPGAVLSLSGTGNTASGVASLCRNDAAAVTGNVAFASGTCP